MIYRRRLAEQVWTATPQFVAGWTFTVLCAKFENECHLLLEKMTQTHGEQIQNSLHERKFMDEIVICCRSRHFE